MTREEAILECLRKGYTEDHRHWMVALDKSMSDDTHDPCKWCGCVTFQRIRGELQECTNCYEVTTRISTFLRTGGKPARNLLFGMVWAQIKPIADDYVEGGIRRTQIRSEKHTRLA